MSNTFSGVPKKNEFEGCRESDLANKYSRTCNETLRDQIANHLIPTKREELLKLMKRDLVFVR